jgi:hypothetical protein
MFTSLVGGIWLETILTAPDYLNTGYQSETQVIIGVLLELINCIAVVGIAVAMFPIFRQQNEALALGYVALRIIEAVILIAAVISPLLLITLSLEYLSTGAPDASAFPTSANLLLSTRAYIAGLLVPIFFSLAALVFYSLLYQSILVPRFISIWGLIAVVLLLAWNLLETFGISVPAGMIFGLPIILNEIFLGIWLIAKGFNPYAVNPGTAKQT